MEEVSNITFCGFSINELDGNITRHVLLWTVEIFKYTHALHKWRMVDASSSWVCTSTE